MLIENMQGHCWHCGQALQGADYHRDSRCPGCDRATHCCRNCRFFAPGAANACREPVADLVSDKDRANFCDYFEPGEARGQANTSPDDLLSAAEDLFN